MGDVQPDTRWMTYAELGIALGITEASATQLAFRRKWPTQAGNDGIDRVSVPIGVDSPQPGSHGDDRGAVRRLINTLEATIAASGERAPADASTIETQAAFLASALRRADGLAGQVHVLQARLATVQTHADTIQAAYDQFRRDTEVSRTGPL
jgi:hypothetical protein